MERWREAQESELRYWLWFIRRNNLARTRAQERVQLFCQCLLIIGDDPNVLTGKRILNVGSGPNGGILNFIKGASTCVALDPLLKYKLLKVKENIERVVGLGEGLPFVLDKFDIIFTINMLDHVNNPSKVLKEAYRVLSEEGTLCLMVNIVKPWEKALNPKIERPLRRIFRSRMLIIYRISLWIIHQIMGTLGVHIYSDADYHPFYFTRGQVEKMLQQHGFRVTKLKIMQPLHKDKHDLFAVCIKNKAFQRAQAISSQENI